MQRHGDEPRSMAPAHRPVGSGEIERVRRAMRIADEQAARSKPGHTPHVEDLRLEVERRMVRGDRFSDVEDFINSSGLSADQKSALWLLGWSYVNWRAQRREARAHLTALAPHQPPPPARRRRTLRLVS
jgi:hypothetical protein